MRSLPDCTSGSAETMMSIMYCVRPAIRSGNAGPLPLYGTCTALMPVIMLNIAAPRWGSAPLPEDAKDSCSGLLFASATRSCTDFTGRPLVTTSSCGDSAKEASAARSLRGS